MKLNSELKVIASQELQKQIEEELSRAKAAKKKSIKELINEHGNRREDTGDNSESLQEDG